MTDLELSVAPLLRDSSVGSWNLLNAFMTNLTLLPIHTENPNNSDDGANMVIAPTQPLYKLMSKNCPVTFNHEIRGKEGKQWQK